MNPVEVTWVLEVTSTRRRRPSKIRVVELPGRILEVSITGAQIEGPADPLLPIGAKVTVRVRGEDSTVIVRRSVPSSRPKVREYGVKFDALGQDVGEQVAAILGRGRPPEDSWLRAR